MTADGTVADGSVTAIPFPATFTSLAVGEDVVCGMSAERAYCRSKLFSTNIENTKWSSFVIVQGQGTR